MKIERRGKRGSPCVLHTLENTRLVRVALVLVILLAYPRFLSNVIRGVCVCIERVRVVGWCALNDDRVLQLNSWLAALLDFSL